MEPETNQVGNNEVAQAGGFATRHNLNRVTPVSKYLALALFVALPFIGGYIGYIYAPEKVVEMERIAEVDSGNNESEDKLDELSNSFYKSKSDVMMTGLFRNENIALNVEPFSDKLLNFSIGSQVSIGNNNLYFDSISFDSANRKVLLNGNYDKPLLELHLIEEGFELENFLLQDKLKMTMKSHGLSEAEANKANKEFVRESLSKKFPNQDFSQLDWRDVCKLDTWDYNGTTFYSLGYDEEKYGEFTLGFFCGAGSYEIHDDLLIYNPGMPVDATEPKVMRGSIKLLKSDIEEYIN